MQDVKGLLASLKHNGLVRIAVVGDVCLDHYYLLDAHRSERSVETGLQTKSVRENRWSLGGAGNVAVNLRSINPTMHIDLYGVIGKDPEGDILLSLCKEFHIGTSGLILQSGWMTNVYHKCIENNVELPRFDMGNFNKVRKSSFKHLFDQLKHKVQDYDAVVINEQLASGMWSEQSIGLMNQMIGQYPSKLWLCDSRHHLGAFKQVIYKVNRDETASALQCGSVSLEKLVQKAYVAWGFPFVMTLGREGAISFDGTTMEYAFGIDFTAPTDSVGAGDAFMAMLAMALCSHIKLGNAIWLADLMAAASTLTLNGCGHPCVKDLESLLADGVMWRFNAELACGSITPHFLLDSNIELVNPAWDENPRALPKVAIFDNDGTISVLRQGWEQVMQTVMEESIIAGEPVSPKEKETIRQEVSHLINVTTGIQTIIQMEMLISLVRQHGHAKPKTAHEYKAIYLDALKSAMQDKLNALRRGELDPSDLTMKGSLQFLRCLHNAGVKLYLASGTDQTDVVREATLLGYASLFDGHIKGSIGDMKNDPKKIVVERILCELAEQHISPEVCVIFGDGPVEMREAHTHGLLAVGILSDERQRFGVNPAKRQRLILAGADVLVPDFSQMYRLFKDA
jgi:sugar/nucleoside kinase (ribokinase family)/phosphoglycolate phosphatase-like HAD superfamily hydrolase